MKRFSRLPDDDAQLSLDFIVGFTIFLIAFIFVATMISGLLISLQSRTIDYDAVAYRTSVILVEDPGEPYNWHLIDITYPLQRDTIKRLGLSIYRQYPNILQQQKENAFFNHSASSGCYFSPYFCFPDDYRNKLIFGDYPYSFNVTLRNLEDPISSQKSVGNAYPPKHGHIRRIVLFKQPGAYMPLNFSDIPISTNNTTIHINFSNAYTYPDRLYRFDLLNELTTIQLRNITSDVNLTEFPKFFIYPTGEGVPTQIVIPENSPTIKVINCSDTCTPTSCDCKVDNTTEVRFEEGFFRRFLLDEFSRVDIKLQMDQDVFDQEIYYFNYLSASLSDPKVAILEVRVW